ncbi:GNAT family N-acetyltransferase [Mesorhizobium sp. BR1-1-16]|uniref:GNAT family N-acetyltransferase n=1 Tax=Mesorhizobium sp. BR1-1-16 TaxID=2876653 RepID=UPI001CCDE077|nr:GNAT family N-acetyltransferase [Mesorhizobium sp. BR1-1-16]MBZ9937689.1 GNAT family N-acetyltransferase [Mesorhizobium sp. BR1-1-16]
MPAYRSKDYVDSLSEFGEGAALPASGGWFLRRPINGQDLHDGMTYPFLACDDWSALADDIEGWRGRLVSLAVVPDPFGRYEMADLERAFPDRLVPFKHHHVADLSLPLDRIVSSHHAREAARAFRRVDVEVYAEPSQLLDDWLGLFDHAIAKFDIRGIRKFSRRAFERQLALPGAFMTVARLEGTPVAAHIQLVGDGVVYAHAAAASPLAYKVGAAYALYHRELEYFADKAQWIDWGGEAGLAEEGKLSSFKAGWSTGVRQSYFCGRILDAERYAALASMSGTSATPYFPAYRLGEFD